MAATLLGIEWLAIDIYLYLELTVFLSYVCIIRINNKRRKKMY